MGILLKELTNILASIFKPSCQNGAQGDFIVPLTEIRFTWPLKGVGSLVNIQISHNTVCSKKGGGGGRHRCPIFQPIIFCSNGAPRGPVGPIVIRFTRPLTGILSVAKNNQFHTIKVQMGIHVYYSKKLSYTLTTIFKTSYIIRIRLWEISVDLKNSWVYRATINRHIKPCENSKFYIIQFSWESYSRS